MDLLCCSKSLSGGRRRPLGSRRRQLEWMTNFVLLVVSLFGVTAGAGLLGFYKIHLLRFLSMEFFILPMVLLGKSNTLLYLVANYEILITWVKKFNFSIKKISLSCLRWRAVYLICISNWTCSDIKKKSVFVTFLCLHVIGCILSVTWKYNLLGEGIWFKRYENMFSKC